MRVLLGLAVASAVGLTGMAAQAASISFGVTPPGPAIATGLQSTDFNVNVTVPKFNRTLGTLTSISFGLAGTVVADIQFESEDEEASTITATSSATLTLTRPDLSTLLEVTPTQSVTRNVTAYDGATDYTGTSGATIDSLTGTLSATSGLLTGAADLAAFSETGGGTILLPVAAVALSGVDGSGNIDAIIATTASGSVVVTYNFDAAGTAVPEPASLAVLGVGLLGFGLVRRKA